MSPVIMVVWVELLITLVLRWTLLNERLDHTIRARQPDGYLQRDELMELLVNDPKKFARSAPREWLKGLDARTEQSADPTIEQDRNRGNRGFLAVIVFAILGVPLVVAVAILGREAPLLVAIVLLAVQAGLLTYWIQRFLGGCRAVEADNFAIAVAIAGIGVVLVASGLAAILLISRT
jgi:hypothetical protein